MLCNCHRALYVDDLTEVVPDLDFDPLQLRELPLERWELLKRSEVVSEANLTLVFQYTEHLILELLALGALQLHRELSCIHGAGVWIDGKQRARR